jgi:predicted ester cyclase
MPLFRPYTEPEQEDRFVLTAAEAVVERFYQAFRPGCVDSLPDALRADWVDNTLPPGRAPGIEGMRQALHQLHGLLPDLQTEKIRMISSGDMVAVHLVFSGTHLGAFLGAPPSHRTIRFIAFDMHRVAGDRIAESWHLEDNLSLLMQIGVIPPFA